MIFSQVALTVLIGLPICMLVKRTRAYRVTPSTIMGKQDTENASLATTGKHSSVLRAWARSAPKHTAGPRVAVLLCTARSCAVCPLFAVLDQIIVLILILLALEQPMP